jgi:hypothetical protein
MDDAAVNLPTEECAAVVMTDQSKSVPDASRNICDAKIVFGEAKTTQAQSPLPCLMPLLHFLPRLNSRLREPYNQDKHLHR